MPLLQMQHLTYKLLSPQRNIQTKYVAHMSPTAIVTMVCCCCHGSKVSIATKCYHGLLLSQERCAKYEACMLSNSKVMQVLQSVHGNKSYHGLLLPQGTGILAETSYTLKQKKL